MRIASTYQSVTLTLSSPLRREIHAESDLPITKATTHRCLPRIPVSCTRSHLRRTSSKCVPCHGGTDLPSCSSPSPLPRDERALFSDAKAIKSYRAAISAPCRAPHGSYHSPRQRVRHTSNRLRESVVLGAALAACAPAQAVRDVLDRPGHVAYRPARVRAHDAPASTLTPVCRSGRRRRRKHAPSARVTSSYRRNSARQQVRQLCRVDL
ncbi:hypothetical protein C8Q80DRAFT_277184 [Daedaleopsis nitida]|nr:hypothetical protein C8Q80DRAFT_277184 [Daedaleopsis nitida]